jgi:hypothetical protein
MQTLAKYVDLNSHQHINKIMKRRMINTMLYMIENHPFCSITNQQAISVLDLLKVSFDVDDFRTLKDFVKRNLIERSEFEFDSGRRTSALNLGQVVQMALELRGITE